MVVQLISTACDGFADFLVMAAPSAAVVRVAAVDLGAALVPGEDVIVVVQPSVGGEGCWLQRCCRQWRVNKVWQWHELLVSRYAVVACFRLA